MASPKRSAPRDATVPTQRPGAVTQGMDAPRTVSPSDIAFNPHNPPRRRHTDIDGLLRSVASQGVLTPLLLCRAEEWLDRFPQHADQIGDATWVALDGDRRLSAARRLPDVVQQVPYYERSIRALDDTLIRLHTGSTALRLTPIEDAVQLQRLVKQHGWTQQEVADAVSVSQSHVAKRLQLLVLPATVQQAVEDGRVTLKDALALAATRQNVDGQTVRDDDLINRVATLLQGELNQDAHSKDGEPTPISLTALREMAEFHRHQELVEETARTRAKELQARFAHDPRDHVSDTFAHRIHKTDEAALLRAAKENNLLVTPATTGKDTAPHYWRLRIPKAAGTNETASERQRREATLAQDARWQALSAAADHSPSEELLHEVLVATMLIVMQPLPELHTLIPKLVKDHQPIDAKEHDVATQLASTEERTRVAWVMALAHLEAHLRAHDQWTPTDVDYMSLLTDITSYTPTEWEKARMREAAV